MAFLRGALEAAGLVTAYQDANDIERQVFGGHACQVAGATFLAARGIPMAVIQLLGRWSSRAIERYTQSAPLALAPTCQEGRGVGHSWLSRSPWPTPRPMRVSQTRGPGHSWLPRRRPRRSRKRMRGRRLGSPGSSSSRRFARSGRPEADRGPEHFIYLARTRRVHRPG